MQHLARELSIEIALAYKKVCFYEPSIERNSSALASFDKAVVDDY
ncbi:hypothetical protein [Shewanella violacea]|uniref:Uncharacterized protein n=1 Tax=Shewanella violacea (strain JCM 10179 / CIP 106290 / LMG 19151 / DSS12) TaxID=637905 RepID=D4ZHT5_SHEVD|nr:hypothetical protein [Shewanella violacea]BAJ01234.1 hypothetical protein SVI_1263 [Shewanella violacea DSS12]